MLTETRVQDLLRPFELELTSSQIGQVLTYLKLLLRWNQKINLTAIRTPEECLTRHFGESLYLARWVNLQGKLLDIGSGAGFPGLALKIAFPDLAATLLEPAAKKRAFLKEVARACQIGSVDVRRERLEDFLRGEPRHSFDVVTVRAVGQLAELVPAATRCLKPGGQLCLWLSQEQGRMLAQTGSLIRWAPPIAIPLTRQREILVGTLATS
jgi:16S rRNA (guanine527-N7)-methyltransferase